MVGNISMEIKNSCDTHILLAPGEFSSRLFQGVYPEIDKNDSFFVIPFGKYMAQLPKRWIRKLGDMIKLINQYMGGGDRHRSFPGGIKPIKKQYFF